MIAESVYARDSLTTAVRVFGSALTTGSTIADVEAWPERIAAVTPEDVMAAARNVFDRTQAVTGRLVPAGPSAAGAGAAAGSTG
jgi:zinc protease